MEVLYVAAFDDAKMHNNDYQCVTTEATHERGERKEEL